ncbi:hypothetical protein [Paucisalibacillus globulus]|uniref:hypothetical protein n=1 Tax=Paucisalibacillus globulus TaxID=351095 RepID=UPI0020D0F510|nr:hypothetical protein [Paucisalibacillus globulus]
MKTDTSVSLNFLIYIQNIYLNQHESEVGKRFPYLPIRITFMEEFESNFKELWNEISQRIADDHIVDGRIFYENHDMFCQKLFIKDNNSLKDFNEVYHTFKVWWNSFAGHFTMGRSIDEVGQSLYSELGALLVQKGIKPQKELTINLIYDECLVANTEATPYFAILPIRDFFVKYKELVPRLEACID